MGRSAATGRIQTFLKLRLTGPNTPFDARSGLGATNVDRRGGADQTACIRDLECAPVTTSRAQSDILASANAIRRNRSLPKQGKQSSLLIALRHDVS